VAGFVPGKRCLFTTPYPGSGLESPMRRLLPLFVMCGALAVSGGCAASAGTGANWVQPAAADASTGPSDPAGPADPTGSGSPSTAASPSAAATPKPTPTKKNPPPPAGSGLVQQLLAQVNQLRAQNGLRPYKLSNGLIASAHLHNLKMMPPSTCGLSHRCPGEEDLGPRITDQGVIWSSAGENIGEEGPVGNNQASILKAAKDLTLAMFNEKPPDDGHRRNILSSGFTLIGIDVVRDSKGTVWLTQDFASLR
jgi:uncharacterized protein YkwD